MDRAAVLFLALILGAVWPATSRPAGPVSTTVSELVAWHSPALPGGVRSHLEPKAPDTSGTSGGRTPARRGPRGHPTAASVVHVPVRVLPRREAAAHAADAASLPYTARQALTRAGLLSSPTTAPPTDRLD